MSDSNPGELADLRWLEAHPTTRVTFTLPDGPEEIQAMALLVQVMDWWVNTEQDPPITMPTHRQREKRVAQWFKSKYGDVE